MPLLVLWSFPLLIQIRVKSSPANYQLIYGMPVHLAQALFLAFGLILQKVCSQIWRLSLAKATSPILFDILQLSVWIIPSQSSFLFWFYYLLWLLFTSLILPVQNLWKILLLFSLSSVQSLSHVWLFVTPWTTACQVSLSITNSHSPPKPMSNELVMPSNHLILCRPLLLLPSTFPSIRVFSNEPALHIRWPNYWSFSFNISPSDEHPGLISFTMDWMDLLAVQETLKSLLQHHSSKASIFQCSAFFTLQLSLPYMTTGKTIALTRWTFVGKVMSLIF